VTYVDYSLIVLCVVLFLLNARVQRLDKGTAALILRGDDRLNDVRTTASEAHRRCSEALKSKTEHEARIRELYERCNSLQAQINVANRAAEHARGVR
jgi:hypothetical protein